MRLSSQRSLDEVNVLYSIFQRSLVQYDIATETVVRVPVPVRKQVIAGTRSVRK